jgi:hypothetical protein
MQHMAKGSFAMETVIFILAIGAKAQHMAAESTHIAMEPSIRAASRTTFRMDLGWRCGLMDQSTMGNSRVD